MIDDIKGINIKGRCFKTDTSLLFYQQLDDRVSIIYGKNGSGKSTISEGIANLSHPGTASDIVTYFIDSNKQELSLNEDSNVFVFNENYIDENVKIDDDGLGTIVLLGGQIDLQSEIDLQEECIKNLTDGYNNILSEYEKYQDKSNPLSPDYHKNRITRVLKQEGGWAETDSQIKGNKIKSQVTDSIIKEIGTLSVKDNLAVLEKKFGELQDLLYKVSDSSVSYPDEIKEVTVDQNLETFITDLLAIKIDKPILSKREQLILSAIQEGSQSRIESARSDFSQKEIKVCPYCYQSVNDEYKHKLVESINKVLNKDVDEHKAQLASVNFPIISFDYDVLSILDSDLSKNVLLHQDICIKTIEQYKELINKKIGSIYNPIIIEPIGLMEKIKELNTTIKLLEEKRLKYNDAANKKSSVIVIKFAGSNTLKSYSVTP